MNSTDFKDVEGLHSILDFIRWGASQMASSSLCYGHGTDNGWDESVALVLGALGLANDMPPAYATANLTLVERERLWGLIRRRCVDKVPVPYLVNRAYFAGLEFYVNDNVVIPRSPIGELIEQQFEPWVIPEQVERILDLCTGSGCIALACAHYFPHASVDAVELSESALEVARQNLRMLGVEQQLDLLQGNLFEAVQGRQYDLIVSNPPYVNAEEMANLPDEFLHEPDLGLAAGEDGLDVVRQILKYAPEYLRPQGVLICEVGYSKPYLEQAFPELPLNWLDFERGGEGVFCIQGEELAGYVHQF